MRCQWCGNRNPDSAQTCAFCQRDLTREQTTVEAVHLLENLELPESDVICPECGAANFIGTQYCGLCGKPLHPGLLRPLPSGRPKRMVRPLPDGLLWAGIVVPVVAVLGLVALLVLGVVNRDGQPDGTSVVGRLEATDAGMTDVVEEVDPLVFDDGYKRLIPKEHITDEPATQGSAGGGRTGSGGLTTRQLSNWILIRRPWGVQSLGTKSESFGDGRVEGFQSVIVERSILDVQPEYDRASLEAILEPEGLTWQSSRKVYPKGGTKQQLAQSEEVFRVKAQPDCHIKVTLQRLYNRAAPACELRIDYVLDDDWRVSLGL